MTEEQENMLRKAFQAGIENGIYGEDEYIESLKAKPGEEETITLTYQQIRLSCGWSDFCDVTGKNHYAVKEYGMDDSERFTIPLSQYKQLNLKIN